ncbi:MAG TPA: MFS transporter [Acidimicrobiales bacterium]|jgi:EmrB/QacA subfamily drug resistance transporter|nr:MFS transporter [Acidimicrobiales bacterium]
MTEVTDPAEAPTTPAASAEPDPKRWSILAVVVIAQLMVVLDASIVTIALPSAQRALNISVANRQWVITAYTLAFGGLLLLGGRIADFGGRKRMFIVGLIGFAGASALGGLAADQAMLFGARALQGAFAAVMAPAALSLLTITFRDDPKERAKAFGAYGAVSGAGGAIGVLAGGVLTQYASWRWCLLVNVPIAVLTAFAALRVVHESREIGTTRYDIPGALLSTAGLVSLVYGFTKAETDGWASTTTLILLSVAAVLLAAFVLVESRSSHPLLPLRVMSERNRAGAYLSALLTGAGLFAMFVFLSYYMQGVLHYSALKAGVAFLPFAAGIIAAAGASSSLVPRIGPRIPMTLGLGVGALGLAWLTQIGVGTSYWTHVLPPEILMSVGLGLAFPALSSTALVNVGDRDSGVASALVNTAQQVGGSLGTALLNTVAATATATYIASHGPALARAGLVHGYSVAFALGAGMLALGAIVSAVFVTGQSRRGAVGGQPRQVAVSPQPG